jgi:hypothetical protein
MIPMLEQGALRLTMVTAKEFAEEGRLGDGYTCLLGGLHHAEEMAGRGDFWAAELVLRYLQALDDYIARYGVRMD